ncbi:Carbon-nitrogen hydrolase [Coemansia sp. RSA 1200]|nr:Carbon-nitrogen hydrolase [Coemansia sp. RSA 1200]
MESYMGQRREDSEYGASDDLKIADMGAGSEEGTSSAHTMNETSIAHAPASASAEADAAKEDDDYDMIEHHDAGGGQEEGGDMDGLDAGYEGEHVYADYEMADDAMDHDGEYAGAVAETDAGSILATQENGDHHAADYGEYAPSEGDGGIEKEHVGDGMSVDDDVNVETGGQPQQQQGSSHHLAEGEEAAHDADPGEHHQAVNSHDIYDQASQMYDANHADTSGAMHYSMITSEDAANTSLEALSQAISSNVRQLAGEAEDEHSQQQQQQQHDFRLHGRHGKDEEDAGDEEEGMDQGGYDDSQQGLAHVADTAEAEAHAIAQGTESKLVTPVRYKSQARRLAESEGPRTVTPFKRQISRSRDALTSSRLKSKVWGWYDILPDGYRQCKFCPQRYGRLTATTILARHFNNRHDVNASPSTTPTASRRSVGYNGRRQREPSHSRGSQQRLMALQSNQQLIDMADPETIGSYSHAAAAAAAAAAANFRVPPEDLLDGGSSAEATSAPLFHVQGNGDMRFDHDSADEAPHSGSQATQHSAYDDNPLIMQGNFSAMMTSPLSRLGLVPARSAIAAVGQFCAQGDLQKNLMTCVDLIGGAARRGAQMVFLPEASDFIAETRDLTTQLAQSVDGDFMKEIQQAAKDNGIWVSIGIHEQPSPSEMPYNTNAVVSSDGVLVSVYRKLHLFDVSVKDGPKLLESATTARGDRVAEVVETPVGRLGSSVCYDLRFPELAQALRLRGAQLISYPSAFTELTGAAHWELLLRARAVETQTYVFGAAQIGRHNSRRSSHGDAMIVDPWGTVLARCARNTNEPTLATAEINLDYLDKIRREMPVFNHKRSDLFPDLAA